MARNFYVNVNFENVVSVLDENGMWKGVKTEKQSGFKSQPVRMFTEQVIKNVKAKAGRKASQKVVRQLVKGALRQKDIMLLSIAILFHRIIARTPEDEDYTRRFFYYNTAKHKKDNDSVKKSWSLSFGFGTFLDSSDIPSEYVEDPRNSEGAIYIYKLLKSRAEEWEVPSSLFHNVRITNSSSHYKYVEYGGISGGKSYGRVDANGGIPHKYPHGLIDGYSIQAPVGMYRRSIAEFDNILQEASSYIGKINHFVADYSDEELDRMKTDLNITNDEIRSKRYSVSTQNLLKELKKL